MFIRGSVIYWFLFLVLRLSGRRDVGSLSVADLLVLLLVADAAGNAMAGESTSLGDGMIVIASIVGWSVVLDRVAYYSPTVRGWLEPSRVCLVKHGRLVPHGMQQEHLTRTELIEQLRLQGIEDLGQVRRAYLESNGQFSVIREPAGSERRTYSTIRDSDER